MTLKDFTPPISSPSSASHQRFAPLRRIKPTEGMMVTEVIWDEAHEFHRQQQRLHGLYAHGSGILTGLQVIASDPADREVYVLPGIAQDSAGNMIVVARPVAFSLGNAQGELQLVLSYGESEPRNEKLSSEDNALRIQSEFLMETRPVQAANDENDDGTAMNQGNVGDGGFVELARIRCTSNERPITNATNPAHPVAQEIDVRFRRWIGAMQSPVLRIGTLALGGQASSSAAGVQALAQSMRALHNKQVWVDEDVVINASAFQYHLLCLLGAGAFELNSDVVRRLRQFVDRGGTLFAEVVGTGQSSAARDSFQALFRTLQLKPEPTPRGHSLLSIPHVFGQWPIGATGSADVLTCNGLIYSTADYARLWHGETDKAPVRREDIRSAHELGDNILTYAQARLAINL